MLVRWVFLSVLALEMNLNQCWTFVQLFKHAYRLFMHNDSEYLCTILYSNSNLCNFLFLSVNK